MEVKSIILFILIAFVNQFSQQLNITDDYLIINARADDPLYTTYTAAMDRSQLYGDKGYKMDYYSDCSPITFSGDQAGRLYHIWKIDKVVINQINEFYSKPVVISSFPDMAILRYEPFRGIRVTETFFVYSSSIAIIDLLVENYSGLAHEIDVYPILELGNDSLLIKDYEQNSGYRTYHYETRKRLVSNLNPKFPYPEHCTDYFTVHPSAFSYGGYSGDMNDFYNIIKTDFYSENRSDSLNVKKEGYVDFISLHSKLTLKPGEKKSLRYIRGWQDESRDFTGLKTKCNQLKTEPLQRYLDNNIKLFSRIPRIDFRSNQEKIVYLSAFNLVRGCMYPPADSAKHNFYVFSRQPLWGWGHGHQVLHESLSMLAYVYLDPESAQGSQRIYMDQQGKDGLIAYRHGPRGMQDYPHFSKELNRDMPTTSAPFFNWINWEVYKVSRDKEFLKDAYKSGSAYVKWLITNRDLDKDGTFEWGPYGIIENVRDWYNAVFQVSAERFLNVDKEDISDELECLDLTLMIIKEMRSLSAIASELGMVKESEQWKEQADLTSNLVNERMWDDSTQFYYSINKEDHSFKFMTRDLRRKEIIGFLPLWAQAVTDERKEVLIKHLTDTTTFWRKYGVPTLSADDEWYTPYVDYCCKWNGPVWLLWDYMVYDGLKTYGYDQTASQLAQKMLLAVTTQLSKNHNFWESYSPDNEVLNSPPNYIWDSIIAKVLIEEYSK